MKTLVYKLIVLILLFFFCDLQSYSQSVQFTNSKNNGIHVKSSTALNLTTQGSIDVWFYLNSFNNFSGIVHKGDKNDFSDEAYTLQLWNNNKLYFALINGSTEVSLQSKSTISASRWYHVAVCWNSSGINMYVNGVLERTTSSSLTLSYSNLTDTSRNGLNIGMQLNEDYNTTYKKLTLNGIIDEVRIWNVKLSTYQVQKRMFQELSSSDSLWNNLVGYYKLNENNGNMVYDSKSSCNPGYFIPSTSDCPTWSSSAFPKYLTWGGSTSDDFEVANNWDMKIKPHAYSKTIIPSGVTTFPYVKTSSTVNVNDLELQSGACLKINSSKKLKVNGNLVFKTANNTSANIIVDGTLEVSGTITFERNITTNGWHYISSPIANTNTNNFMGAALYSYNETSGTWSKLGSNTTLTPLRGYDIYYKNTDRLVSLSGTFNSGNYSLTITRGTDGFNLVGNPYPATIDWAASSGWTKTNLNPTIYIWDPAQGNYMTYSNGVGTNGGSRYIPPTQAFFVRAKSGGGTLGIGNATRVTVTTTTYRADEDINNVLYLKVKCGTFSDETVIRMINDATFLGDDDFDAEKLISTDLNVPQLYTKRQDNLDLTINALPIINKAVTIPMSLLCNATGEYSITPDFIRFNENIDIYLEDIKLQTINNLRSGPYCFHAENTDQPDRFLLHLIPIHQITNNIDEDNTESIEVFNYYGKLYIKSNETELAGTRLNIYNMLGKLVYSAPLKNQKNFVIDLSFLHGSHLVQVVGSKNVSTKTLVF